MSSNDLLALKTTTIPKTSEAPIAQLRRRLRLSRGQLTEASLRRVHYELDLPADERQRAILDRLRAWLALERTEGQHLAACFDDALRLVSDDEKNELRESERDAVFNALTFHGFEQLAELAPTLYGRHANGEWPMSPPASPFAFTAAAMCGVSA